MNLDQKFWNHHWEKRETGWDIGQPSPPITKFMDDYTDKNAAILIPGCGNAYEADYLTELGFTNITVLDIAPKAVELLEKKFQGRDAIQIHCGNFFDFEGSFDLIVEQTFFCAIHPSLRKNYVEKSSALLKPDGQIVGVLFNREFDLQRPPFGGKESEYRELFGSRFDILKMEDCYNSIRPRRGTELFIKLKNRSQ